MKTRCAIISLILMFVLSVQAENRKYLVWLSDKNGTPYSLNQPDEYLSQRAIQRRVKQHIAIDSLDIPVLQSYVDQIKNTGVQIRCTSRWLNTVTVMTDSLTLIDQISQFSFVDSVTLTWIEPEKKSARMKLETLSEGRFDYGLSEVQLDMHEGPLMHHLGFTGKGKLIAVLDAGFYHVDTLPAFDSLWHKNQILLTKDVVNPGGNVFEGHSHGMAVLSIMGGNIPGYLIGSAPDATYALIRTEDANSEYPVEMDYWIAGAEFADSIGADLINSSLGYSVFDDPDMNYQINDLNGWNIRVTRGADIAASRGILVVTSAGNEGNKTWKRITGPADGKKVLAVGSVNKDSTYTVFSSRGPSSDNRVKPDITANGYHTVIQYATGRVGTGNGTSFSSPVMAGMAACLWQSVPRKTSEEIRDLIISASDRYMEPNNSFGYGIPNIYKAFSTSVDSYENMNEARVYPTFVYDDVVYIEASQEELLWHLQIYDLYGRVVDEMPLNESYIQRIHLKPLPQGIYIFKIKVKLDIDISDPYYLIHSSRIVKL